METKRAELDTRAGGFNWKLHFKRKWFVYALLAFFAVTDLVRHEWNIALADGILCSVLLIVYRLMGNSPEQDEHEIHVE